MRSILSLSVVSPALGAGLDPEDAGVGPADPFAAAILASLSRYCLLYTSPSPRD